MGPAMTRPWEQGGHDHGATRVGKVYVPVDERAWLAVAHYQALVDGGVMGDDDAWAAAICAWALWGSRAGLGDIDAQYLAEAMANVADINDKEDGR